MAPSKPIQEQIYKSRLTITYRTTITGTVQQENLPFRLLVLGDFAGRSRHAAKLVGDLGERRVRTIKRGTTVNDHLGEVLPIWRIPPDDAKPAPRQDLKELRSLIPGTVEIKSITLLVPQGLKVGDTKNLPLSGTVLFKSDHRTNGFADFETQTLNVDGEIAVTGQDAGPTFGAAQVRVKGTVVADLLDRETRASIGKIVGLSEGSSVAFTIANAGGTPSAAAAAPPAAGTPAAATPAPDGTGTPAASAPAAAAPSTPAPSKSWLEAVDSDDTDDDLSTPITYTLRAPDGTPDNEKSWTVHLERVLPITSLDSFSPDEISSNVPEIGRTRLLKQLLARLQSELRNRPPLRNFVKSKLSKDGLADFGTLQGWVNQNLHILKIDPAAAAVMPALAPPSATPAPAPAPPSATPAPAPASPSATPAPAAPSAAVTKVQDAFMAPLVATSSDLYSPSNQPWSVVRQLDNGSLKFHDRDTRIPEGAWLMNGLAVVLANVGAAAAEMRRIRGVKPKAGAPLPTDSDDLTYCLQSYTQFLTTMSTLNTIIDGRLRAYLDAVYHNADFQDLEAAWRGLSDIAASVEADDVFIDFLDAERDELKNDVVDHDLDIFSGELFKKVYLGEYDRYGGKPFASMIGLYYFDSTAEDIQFLRALGRVANASHCPFVGAASPRFFFPYTSIEQVAEINDLDGILGDPRFGKFQELRDTEYAAYLGLTLPRYLVREPWKPEALDNDLGYVETVPFFHGSLPEDTPAHQDEEALKGNLLWGNAVVLFAKNMVASYQGSGWAQYIRGPMGGGLCEGLVSYKYTRNGYEELQPPVEISIPDYRELQFANNGFIPLVHKKGEAVATFFSAQSIKKSKKFVEDLSTQNAALVTNMAYTFSITRIAHFVKRMMREYIGANADGPYIQKVLAAWLGQYVTIVSNPDDLTLRYYPFKAATVDVQPKPGPLGWYKATIKILPHIQFEGMDVELQLEAALGGP